MSRNFTCSTSAPTRNFIPQDHQIRVMKEFLSTNQRGLLFYHQLGSGKCVLPETKIWVGLNGNVNELINIKDLWDITDGTIYEKSGGEWKEPFLDRQIYTKSYKDNKICLCPIKRLYREKINEVIRDIRLSN